MGILRWSLAAAAGFIILAGTSLPAPAGEGAIKYRQSVMKAVGGHMGAMATMHVLAPGDEDGEYCLKGEGAIIASPWEAMATILKAPTKPTSRPTPTPWPSWPRLPGASSPTIPAQWKASPGPRTTSGTSRVNSRPSSMPSRPNRQSWRRSRQVPMPPPSAPSLPPLARMPARPVTRSSGLNRNNREGWRLSGTESRGMASVRAGCRTNPLPATQSAGSPRRARPWLPK